jgi:hypothetical protein
VPVGLEMAEISIGRRKRQSWHDAQVSSDH